MDLSDLSATTDFVLELRNPNTGDVLTDDDAKPVSITFCNIDTKQHVQARNELINKERALKARNAVVAIEDENKASAEFFAAITKGWSGIRLSGEALEFNKVNALRVYSGDVPWLSPQLAVCLLRMARREMEK